MLEKLYTTGEVVEIFSAFYIAVKRSRLILGGSDTLKPLV
jgi:hypothetical protein